MPLMQYLDLIMNVLFLRLSTICNYFYRFLPRRSPVQINRNKRIENIRNPRGDHRADVAVDGECGCDGREEDIRET